MIRNLIAVAALAAAGVATAAAPAAAVCAGTTNTIVVCSDPTGATWYSDCVYAGTDPCTQVDVPGPTLSCDEGKLLDAFDLDGQPVSIRHVDCDL